METDTRSFLLLQGVASPFFARLADALKKQGHRVYKVNFNAGDATFWLPRGRSAHFQGRLEHLSQWLERIWVREGITDQILFGDRRPVHHRAVQRAERYNIRTHVFEEGYFRPYWITLEREGVNGHSLLPRDPDWFRRAASFVPKLNKPTHFKSAFIKRAGYDVLYHVAGLFNPVLNVHYRNHSPIIAPVEYSGYIWRFLRLPWWRRRDPGVIKRFSQEAVEHPYFVLPLQLNTDAQIRDHSRFEDMFAVIRYVLASFAAHAPRNARLLIKNHPLDMGLVNYARLIEEQSKEYQVEGRVDFVETGDLNRILKHATGTITVNSTVGMVSLQHDCPTVCLSDPIYNLPGLTSQQGLDAFWSSPCRPDSQLLSAFYRVVMYATQLNGGFYCHKGIGLAVEDASRVLSAEQSPLEYLLEQCPP